MADPGQAANQAGADRRRVGQQPVGLDGGKHRQRGRAGHRVAAERAAVIAPGQCGGGRAEPDAGADRQPAAQPLGQREHIRHHPVGLVREPAAGAADAALDLVDDQQRALGVAHLAGGGQVAGRRGHHPRLTLAGLQEDGGAVGPDRGGQRAGVAVPDEQHLHPEGAKRLAYRLLASQRERAHAAAVESALGRDHDRAARALLPPDQLERRLVRFGARVGEEHPAVRGQQPQQPFGQRDLALVQEQVGGVRDGPHLPAHRLDDGRVRVPE